MVFCGDPTMISAEASCEFVPKGSPQKYEKTRIYSSMWTAVLLASPCTYRRPFTGAKSVATAGRK